MGFRSSGRLSCAVRGPEFLQGDEFAFQPGADVARSRGGRGTWSWVDRGPV